MFQGEISGKMAIYAGIHWIYLHKLLPGISTFKVEKTRAKNMESSFLSFSRELFSPWSDAIATVIYAHTTKKERRHVSL